MYRSIFIFLLILASRLVQANPDSLLLELKKAETKIEKTDIYNKLSDFYILYDFEKSLEYGNIALRLSTEINYLKGEGVANLNLGWVYWLNAYYDQSHPLLQKARRIFAEIEDVNNLAKANRLIGLLHQHLVQEDSAIMYLELANQQFLEDGDTTNYSLTLSDLSFSYAHIGDMALSNELSVKAHVMKLTMESIGTQYHTWLSSGHFDQAYQNEEVIKSILSQKLNDYKALSEGPIAYKYAQTASEIGDLFQIIHNYDSSLWFHQISAAVYDSLSSDLGLAFELVYQGECHIFKKEYDLSDPLFEQAYTSYVKAKNYAGVTIPLDYLGKNALRKKQFKKALNYFKKALALADSVGHGINVLRFTRRLSDTYREMGNLDNALEKASSAYDLAKEIGGPNHIMWGAEKLYLAYKKKNDYKKAYEFLSIHDQLALDIQRNLLNKESLQFQSAFELNEKTREVEFLNVENTNKQTEIDLQKSYLISAVVGLFGMCGLALGIGYRVRRIRSLNKQVTHQNKELTVMNKDKEILLKEVHHRVKNNLQMMSSLLGMQKRRVLAPESKEVFSQTQTRLRSIGLIHEHLYKNNSLSSIYLKDYVADLVDAIFASAHLGKRPELEINVPHIEIDIDTSILAGLILNELVTNSIKHAFPTTTNPLLKINIEESAGRLYLEISDNGPGGNIEENGFGWTIIESMVSNMDGSITVNGESGFSVLIQLSKSELFPRKDLGYPS